jgi:TonB family protein
MRKVLLMASLLICLMSVSVFAQEISPAQKSTTEPEQPKNAVDQAVEEAKERGETIVSICIVDCGGAPTPQGVESGRALELPKPEYPMIARAARATGTVEVKVLIGFDGNVIAAASISGHPLLQAAAVSAARDARFTPVKLNGQAVKVVGVIQYHFVAL